MLNYWDLMLSDETLFSILSLFKNSVCFSKQKASKILHVSIKIEK